MELIIKYYVCSYIMKKIGQYQNAYEVTYYLDYLYEMVGYIRRYWMTDDLMEACWEIDEDYYVMLSMQRYSWYFRRMVDYVIFLLSQKQLLPNLGKLVPVKSSSIYTPDRNDLTSVSYCTDTGRPDYCYKFLRKLFHMAGWNICKISKARYIQQYGNLEVEVPYYDDDNGYVFWDRIFLDTIDMETDFYIFASDIRYSSEEQLDIFLGFCRNGILCRVDANNVIVAVQPVTQFGDIQCNNDWSQFSPLSGLAAWCAYLYKRVIAVPKVVGNTVDSSHDLFLLV